MRTLLRPLLFSLFVSPVAALAATTAPVDNKAKPAAPPPPARLDVVTFVVHSEGQNHKLVVTLAPTLMRVDRVDENYSVIYNDQTQSYLGLEHSNYTYWQFSWPEIQTAIESTKRYESRMQELNLAGIESPAPTNKVPGQAAASSIPDTSGYVWHPTVEHKTITGLDCVRWSGETASGDSVQAWCFNGPLPKLTAAIDRLSVINEPMALAAIRTIVPAYVFPIYSTLTKGGVTPVMIVWGGSGNKNTFALADSKTRDFKPDLFTVPKLYMKTTLISLDGLIDQKK